MIHISINIGVERDLVFVYWVLRKHPLIGPFESKSMQRETLQQLRRIKRNYYIQQHQLMNIKMVEIQVQRRKRTLQTNKIRLQLNTNMHRALGKY